VYLGANAAPGFIRAFNVRTGELAWTFHTIPLPGEFGYDTWAHDSYQKLGGANNWAGLVVDEKRGMVFAGTGSPSGDFYGGDRKGQNLFSNSILALNAKTGKEYGIFKPFIMIYGIWICPLHQIYLLLDTTEKK